MSGLIIGTGLGRVTVTAENGRGHPPEFWAEKCVERIVGISDMEMPDHVRQQAHAFRDAVAAVTLHCMREAIKSDRSTVKAFLIRNGHEALAKELEAL